MLYIGEIIKGRWNNNSYIVLSKLGQGGVGAVYKIRDRFGNIRALKISQDMNSITREYENIKRFKSARVVPRIYEMDDYKKYGEVFHFFVLQYIEGYNLKEIMKMKNFYIRDIITILIVILKNLKLIYDLGYVYGDIKLENIMIDKARKIYLIDFGGAIEKNLGIKEYTPTYNIVSWGIDNKDYNTSIIFSMNMILTSMILKEEPSPLIKNLGAVTLELKDRNINRGLEKVMIDGLHGRYKDIDDYISKLQTIITKKTESRDIDLIDYIFKGSIFIFIIVITVSASIKWM